MTIHPSIKKNYFFHLSNRETNEKQISVISFIRNILDSLQLKIKTVILIGELRSHISVRQHLPENKVDVCMLLTVERIYNMFLDTD
jgi:hypothetical protein